MKTLQNWWARRRLVYYYQGTCWTDTAWREAGVPWLVLVPRKKLLVPFQHAPRSHGLKQYEAREGSTMTTHDQILPLLRTASIQFESIPILKSKKYSSNCPFYVHHALLQLHPSLFLMWLNSRHVLIDLDACPTTIRSLIPRRVQQLYSLIPRHIRTYDTTVESISEMQIV